MASIFSNISIPSKDPESTSDDKMNKRAADMYKTFSSVEDMKESNIAQELIKKKSNLENEIEMRRKKNKTIPISYGKSLIDNISIDLNVYEQSKNLAVTAKDLEVLVNNLNSSNPSEQYLALVGIRKLICIDKPPIQEIIDKGLVFAFVELLNHQFPEFVYEAISCLTLICSGTPDQSNTVISKGGAKIFIHLCDSVFFEIQEQAILGIGNLASENVTLRDKLIDLGALEKIKFYLQTSERRSLLKNCLFCLTNFTRGTPIPSYEAVSPVSFIYHIIVFRLRNKLND